MSADSCHGCGMPRATGMHAPGCTVVSATGRLYDQEQDGLRPTLIVVDELAAWPPDWRPEAWQEELLERWDTERPFVIVTGGGRRDGMLERAWGWLSWREELRVPRWALFATSGLATWGVVQLLVWLSGGAA